MKPLALAVALLGLSSCAQGAISAAMEWDVRTTGNDGNGGAFKRGATGTDFSQQDAAQVSYVDLIVGATTTQVTSALHAFDGTFVGNIINITAGTGCTTGRFEVVSVATITATLDRSAGTAASTCTAVLGGSMATVGATATAMVTQNSMHVKSGTYTVTATIVTPGSNHYIEGFGTAHYDGGAAPLITTATDSTKLWQVAGTAGGNGVITFYNMNFSTTATTKSQGLFGFNSLNAFTVNKAKFTGFTIAINANNDIGFNCVGDLAVYNSEFDTGTQAINTNCVVSQSNGAVYLYGSYIHGYTSASGAIQGSNGGPITLSFSVMAANATCIGGTPQANLINSNFYANTGNCVTVQQKVNCINSIFYGNAGGATQVITEGSHLETPGCGTGRNNAFGGNTKNFPTGTVASMGEITLTADPFTSSTNFTLNSTAGGGAACKKAGFVPTVTGSTASATLDVGAIQSAAGGGQVGAAFTATAKEPRPWPLP